MNSVVWKAALGVVLVSGGARGATLVSFDFAGLTGSEASSGSDFDAVGVEPSTISRGPGLSATANADRFNASAFSTSLSASRTDGDFFTFTVTPTANYELDLTDIDFNFQRSLTGPTSLVLYSSIAGFTAGNEVATVALQDVDTVQAGREFDLPDATFADLRAPVTFRVYGVAEGGSGTGGFEGSGNDLVINGSAVQVPEPAAISVLAGLGLLGLRRRRRHG